MPHTPILTPARVLIAAAALAVVGVLTLAPRALIRPVQDAAVDACFLVIDRWGGPTLAVPSDVVLNVALYVPVGLGVAALVPVRWSPVAVFVGGVTSFTIETAQALIPGRVPDPDDVLSNTVGTAIGVSIVVAARVVAHLSMRAAQLSRG